MRLLKVCAAVLVAVAGLEPALAQNMAGEWTHYGGNAASLKYSPLDQINKDNVAKLTIAWRWTSPDNAVVAANPLSRPGMYHDTPLMVKGVLYTVTSLGQIAAINPGTGQTIWSVRSRQLEDRASGQPWIRPSRHRVLERLLDFARGRRREERLLLGTGDAYLISVDAKTGALDPSFGEGGKVDLMAGLAYAVRATQLRGDRRADRLPRRDHRRREHPRRADATRSGRAATSADSTLRTGKRLWTLHSIPQKGEFGNETWADDSAQYTGSTNVWTNISRRRRARLRLPAVRHAHRRLVRRPSSRRRTCSPKAWWRSTRERGERKWHFQAVHHGVWDYDFPAAPLLVDITVNGKDIKAVAQVSKQGFTYVFDRKTGTPVWPIEERPVPQSKVPGERSSPTQPFPTRPPAFERQGVTENDLIDFTPELKQAALEAIKNFDYGPLFTPPSERGAIAMPGWVGGANWGGAAFDPETGTLYVPSMTSPIVIQLVKPNPTASNLLYNRGGVMMPPTLDGLPIVKPPYSRVTAIDLNRGDIKWMSALGDGPRNHRIAERSQPAAARRRHSRRAAGHQDAVVRGDGPGEPGWRPQPGRRRTSAEPARSAGAECDPRLRQGHRRAGGVAATTGPPAGVADDIFLSKESSTLWWPPASGRPPNSSHIPWGRSHDVE